MPRRAPLSRRFYRNCISVRTPNVRGSLAIAVKVLTALVLTRKVPFQHEDKRMIEKIQQQMGTRDLWSLIP